MRGTKPLSTESDNNQRKQDKESQLMIKTDVRITTKRTANRKSLLERFIFRKEVAKDKSFANYGTTEGKNL